MQWHILTTRQAARSVSVLMENQPFPTFQFLAKLRVSITSWYHTLYAHIINISSIFSTLNLLE